MPTNLTKKIYTYVWHKDSMYNAEIIFEATAPDKWKFSQCNFTGVPKAMWNEDNWEFIYELSKEVLRLITENE